MLSGWPLDTAISQYVLRDIFSYADSKHIFFFFDACQIGGMATLASSGRYVAMASDKIAYHMGTVVMDMASLHITF